MRYGYEEEVLRDAHRPWYICAWSGGKDSTASIILCHLRGLPLDEIVYAEPMFDGEISADNPLQTDFIYNYAKPLFESWGYRVTILRSKTTFMSAFNHVMKRATKYPEHVGMRYGFALPGMCAIQRDCKLKPMKDYIGGIPGDVVQYVGICKNESKRLETLHSSRQRVSILEKYGYTEADSFELCRKFGLLSPSYGIGKRGGCWHCIWAKVEEQAVVKELYPEVWQQFVSLEKEEGIAHRRWSTFEKRLKNAIGRLMLILRSRISV